MERDEQVSEGQAFLECLENVLKRTPREVAKANKEAESGEEFESAEHENIGNEVKLRFPKLDPVKSAERALRLPNGVKLTYGQIVALAGDFYGIPDQPIVDPSEKEHEKAKGQRGRFIAAYNTLGRKKGDKINKELSQILKIMAEEKEKIEEALDSRDEGDMRILPSDVYEELGYTLVKKWDEKLGGTWLFGVPIVLGRMMKLAINNHDHFLPFAKEAYLAGHGLALEKAVEASGAEQHETKILLLEEAYSIDAFACHFLTDSFSSGHLRTPRRELSKKVTPSKLGDYLSNCMHDEDSKFGIRVKNERGDKWIAYGDGMVLDPKSNRNHKISVDAVQTSVDHVYEAFQHGQKPSDSGKVTSFIPFVDEEEKNNYPMFQVKSGKLLRRADLTNLTDSKTVSDWYGITTGQALRSYKPKGSAIGKDGDDIDCRSCGQSLDPKITA